MGHCGMLVSEGCSTIIFSIKAQHSKGTGRSPGSSVGCEGLQLVKWNVSLFKDRLDLVFEAFLLSTNIPVVLFQLTVMHDMGQSAVLHSDDMAQIAKLAMEEYRFN